MPSRDPLPPGPFLLRSGRIEIRAANAVEVCSALGLELAGRPAEVIDLVNGRTVPVASFLAEAPADGSTTAGLEDLLRTDGVEVASASTIAAMPAATPELRRPGVVITSPGRGRTPAPAVGNSSSKRSRSSQQSPLRGQRGHLDERRPGSRVPWLGLLLGGAGVLLVVVFVLLIGRRPPPSPADPTPHVSEESHPLQAVAEPRKAPATPAPHPAVPAAVIPIPASAPAPAPAPVPALPLAPRCRATASWIWSTDPIAALNDGILPANSADTHVPRMTWYGHSGDAEWVQYDFPQSAVVDSVDVYWFEDRQGCFLPASWQVLYRDGDAWKPVQGAPPVSTIDCLNHFAFPPVTTTALRVAVVLQPERSSGILEWQVGSRTAP